MAWPIWNQFDDEDTQNLDRILAKMDTQDFTVGSPPRKQSEMMTVAGLRMSLSNELEYRKALSKHREKMEVIENLKGIAEHGALEIYREMAKAILIIMEDVKKQ